MFYSEAILSRRGPLAKVWLAAHMERKLSKTQTLQTDIEKSVEAIMGQEVEVMALRLSGQLLLGVVRIYSRKAKYLLDDCNEALLKIKMAFRPGLVDMTEDQLAVNRNAITLQAGGVDLDLLLPDINWEVDFEERPVQSHSQHVARAADITLAPTADLTFDFDDVGYGLDLGPGDGIGAQDYDIDLGLSFGDNDETMSIEQGRDAAAPRFSLDSHFLGKPGADKDLDLISNVSRHVSEDPFAPDVGMFAGDFAGDIDLDLTFDILGEKTPSRVRSPSRASSPLTELPGTPPPDDAAVAAAAEGASASPVKKKKPKAKKQIIDEVIELAGVPGVKRGRNADFGAPMTKDVSNILTQNHFLPRSATVMRLLEIRDDPLAHFLPTKSTPNGTYFCAGPPGLAPELAELFMRPMRSASSKRRSDAAKSPSKKQKLMNGEDYDDVEQARRAASLEPGAFDAEIFTRESVGPGLDLGDMTGLGMDEFEMTIPEFDAGGVDLDRARSQSVALSRLSTPGADELHEGEETYADLACAIAVFDDRSQSQTQGAEGDADGDDRDGKGYSKNTVKALGIVRRDLQPMGGDEKREKVISFNRVSQKASRRAAASFFFELLVLGTRDCVRLSQEKPFTNIEIRAKERLWERQRHHGHRV